MVRGQKPNMFIHVKKFDSRGIFVEYEVHFLTAGRCVHGGGLFCSRT